MELKLKKLKIFGEFILFLVILSAIVSLIVAGVRFDRVSKLDPDITFYNYKDPILSHLFIYGVVIMSIMFLLPTAICLIIGVVVCYLKVSNF